MTDATDCVVLASASESTCDLTCSHPCVGFGMFAFCCPVHMRRAAPCPLPVTMPNLSSSYPFPGMLMTGGCHGATGITVMDSRLMLIRPPVAVLASPGLPFSLHAAAACGRQPTSVSALFSRPARGPHVWRHGSRPSPSAHAGQDLNARGRDAGPAGIKGQPCGNKGTALRE